MKIGTGVFTDGRNFPDLATAIERIYLRATAPQKEHSPKKPRRP